MSLPFPLGLGTVTRRKPDGPKTDPSTPKPKPTVRPDPPEQPKAPVKPDPGPRLDPVTPPPKPVVIVDPAPPATDPDEEDIDAGEDDDGGDVPPPPVEPPPSVDVSALCKAAGFVGKDGLPFCTEYENVIKDCRKGGVTPATAEAARAAFLTGASNSSVALWLGTLSLTLCEYAAVVTSDLFGADVARAYSAPVLGAKGLTRYLTETARRESLITFDSLNKKSGADSFWQETVAGRAGNREKFATWLPIWPDRRSSPGFVLTPSTVAQHMAVYLVRSLGTLGTFVDFAHGPVTVRPNADPKVVATWKYRLATVGKQAQAMLDKHGLGPLTAEDLLIGMLNGCHSMGCSNVWSEAQLHQNARMILACKGGFTWGQTA